MRTAEAFYNIFNMFLYNKNILEYVKIDRNGTEPMIQHTEGHSNSYGHILNGSLKWLKITKNRL